MRWLVVLALLAACKHRPAETFGCPGAPAFDEALRLFYAFDVEAAEQEFRSIPSCAQAQWGVALALGPNINVPQLPERTAAAREALARAGALSRSALDRELVDALGVQYDHGALAYADAMRQVHARHPDDPDLSALTAAALLQLHPFDQWAPDGTPRPETLELVALLEAARARHPENVGLTHYYIHAVEASPHPERALEAARAIGTMMPAQGHLVHMPSHVFLRTGRYAEAAEWNRKAIAADAQRKHEPLYEMYVLHNHHFLWTALLWLGDRDGAMKEASFLVSATTPAMLEAMPGMEPLRTLPAFTLARFDAWRELLVLPLDHEPFAHALELSLRVQAEARLQLPPELPALEALVAAVPPDRSMGANTEHDVLAVALGRARGESLLAAHHVDEGVAALRRAITAEDALHYDEPPSWPLPTRELLGDRLRELGRCKDARLEYEADLRRNPNNRWSTEGQRACAIR